MDNYDYCDHTNEQAMAVQFFASIEQEEEEVPIIRKNVQPIYLNAAQEIKAKFITKKTPDYHVIPFKTPLDYYKEQKNKQVDHLMTFTQSQDIFSNPSTQKNFGKPRVISHSGKLVVGGSLGHIMVVGVSTDIITQNEKFGSVTALDIDGDVVMAGYEDGSIAAISLKTKHSIKKCPNVSKSRILTVKMIFKGNKKYMSAIACDDWGHSRIVHFYEGVLGTDYELQLALPKQQYPIQSITVLSQEESYKFLPPGDDQKYRIVAVASLMKLVVLQVFKNRDKKLLSLLEVENPHFTSPQKPMYAFVSHGYGRLPPPSLQNQEQWNQPKMLIILCWNAHMFIIIKQEQSDSQPYLALKPLIFGEHHIHYAWFVGLDNIQVITQNQTVYVINTKDLDLHISPKDIGQIPKLMYAKNWKGMALTSLYSVQGIEEDGNAYMRSYPIATAPYANHQCQLYILADSCINMGHLNSWDQAVEVLINNGDWSNAMHLMLTVYDDTLKFSPVPTKKDDIQQKVLKISTIYLKVVIEQIKSTLDAHQTLEVVKGMSPAAEIEVSKVKSFLSLLIDFLLRTCSNVLFNQVYEILKKFLQGDISLFCNELAVYIRNQKAKQIVAPSKVLCEIIEYYHSLKDTRTIEQLIYSLNIREIESLSVVQICLKYQLTKALSHVCTNSVEKDFLTPLAKLWAIVLMELSNSKIEQACEQGYNVLTYLESVIEKIEVEEARQSIIQISCWLFDQQTIVLLLCINLGMTLRLIYKFFTKPIENEFEKDNLLQFWIKIRSSLRQLSALRDPNMLKLFHSQKHLQSKSVEFTELSYTALVIIRGYVELKHGSEVQQLAMKLLSEQDHIQYLPLERANFPEITENDEPTLKYCMMHAYNFMIITLLEKYRLMQLNIEDLTIQASSGDFDYVLVYLAEQSEQFVKALDIKIRIIKAISKLNVVQSNYHIFNWITQILNKPKQINQVQQFKDRILFHIGSLVSLGAIQTRQLISRFFQASDITILNKLGDLPILQLDYIQHILNAERKETQPNDEILRLHINLLCKLKPDGVLAEIQENDYPMDDVIQICRQYDVPDALAFLLERSGAIKEAIKVRGAEITKRIMNRNIANKAELLTMLSEICNLCGRNYQYDDTDECWDTFAQKLLYLAMHNSTPEPFREYLDEYVPSLFTRWAETSNLDMFLEKITTRYLYLSSAKLKRTFLQLYQSQRFLETVFQKIKDIYWVKVIVQHNMLIRTIGRGKGFLGGCYYCRKPVLESDGWTPLVAMFCGHLFHLHCLRQDQKAMYHCPICLLIPNVFYSQLLHALRQKKKKLKQDQGQNKMNSHFLRVIQAAEVRESEIQKVEMDQAFAQYDPKDKLIQKLKLLEFRRKEHVDLVLRRIKYQ